MGKVLQMKTGKINVSDLAKKINKKMGMEVAHDLSQTDPVSVKDWIPTGSRWLDSMIRPGQHAGIPVGKITELAGLSGSGKSFMAAQIARYVCCLFRRRVGNRPRLPRESWLY